jgi:hypothetical protein
MAVEETYDEEGFSQGDGNSNTAEDPNANTNDGPAEDGPAYEPLQEPGGGGAEETTSDNLGDPSAARLSASGLNAGGMSFPSMSGLMDIVKGITTSGGGIQAQDDWRVRISLPPGSIDLYQDPRGNAILGPLVNNGTNGVIFPYTPAIQVTHNARYQEQGLTHSNYKSYFYEGSDVSAITISGEFTVQNQREGEYMLACVHFFRAATKMFFGQSIDAGRPPPIVFLDGYGDFYFPHVSCVITSFQHTMPADVDYIPLVGWYRGTRVPTTSTISVTLQPVYSRRRIHNEFDLGAYAQGLQAGNKRYTGGFL